MDFYDLHLPHVFCRLRDLCRCRCMCAIFFAIIFLTGCAGDRRSHIIVSIPEQKMLLLQNKKLVAAYPVSTSKFALGNAHGSNATPLGELRVRKKIGTGLPLGAVLKDRNFTGEILAVDAPGRDPIVTRILWLDGLQKHNSNSYQRYIYIHGTPEERTIGTPASYGCIRMRSRDVVALYDRVGVGARVTVTTAPLPSIR